MISGKITKGKNACMQALEAHRAAKRENARLKKAIWAKAGTPEAAEGPEDRSPPAQPPVAPRGLGRDAHEPVRAGPEEPAVPGPGRNRR